MKILKKFIYVLALIVLLVYGGLLQAEEDNGPGEDLEFSVFGGKIYFFQPDTGRIFVYQISTNRFSHLLILEELGQDLKQSRSLSAIYQEDK